MRTHVHVLIGGASFTGKSYLARALAARVYKPQGVGVIVLDPTLSPEWAADYQTEDPATFLHAVKNSWQCALFVDEAPSVIGRYDTEMQWCATQSRHFGHRAHFIAQRPIQLAPVVRDQCTLWYLFRVHKSTAKVLADETGLDQVAEAYRLKMYQYMVVDLLQGTVTVKGP